MSTQSNEIAATRPDAADAGQTHNIGRFQVECEDIQILFADLQPTLVAASRTLAPVSLSNNARVLASIARLAAVPMTFAVVQAEGKPGVLIPELQPFANTNAVFHRVAAGTFTNHAMARRLTAQRRKVLVLSGYATEVAVLESALGAIDAGYIVHVVLDAIGGTSSRTELAALRQMEMAGAIPTSIMSLAALFTPVFSQPPGDAVLELMSQLET